LVESVKLKVLHLEQTIEDLQRKQEESLGHTDSSRSLFINTVKDFDMGKRKSSKRSYLPPKPNSVAENS
jgi:hypothetical protein